MGVSYSLTLSKSSYSDLLAMPIVNFELRNTHALNPWSDNDVLSEGVECVTKNGQQVYRFSKAALMAALERQCLGGDERFSFYVKYVRDSVRNWLDCQDFTDKDVELIVEILG